MRLDRFFSGALCALSGGRLPEALFMVFLLDSKGAQHRPYHREARHGRLCGAGGRPSGCCQRVGAAGPRAGGGGSGLPTDSGPGRDAGSVPLDAVRFPGIRFQMP